MEKAEKRNNFREYNFTADFEGEIIKEVSGYFIGYIIQDNQKYSAKWAKNGVEEKIRHSGFNLTPIKDEKTLKDLRQEVSEIETYLEKRLSTLISEYNAKGFYIDINVDEYGSASNGSTRALKNVILEVTL